MNSNHIVTPRPRRCSIISPLNTLVQRVSGGSFIPELSFHINWIRVVGWRVFFSFFFPPDLRTRLSSVRGHRPIGGCKTADRLCLTHPAAATHVACEATHVAQRCTCAICFGAICCYLLARPAGAAGTGRQVPSGFALQLLASCDHSVAVLVTNHRMSLITFGALVVPASQFIFWFKSFVVDLEWWLF